MSKTFEEKDNYEEFKRYLFSQSGDLEIDDYNNLIDCLIEENKIQNSYFWAIKAKKLDVVELLIKKNVDINIQQGEDYNSPIHEVVKGYFYPEIMELLINNNADINLRDKYGCTAICSATQSGDVDIMETLINAKADLNIPNNEGLVPLFIGLDCPIEIVDLLIKSESIDMNKSTEDGSTCLHQCVNRNKNHFLELLITNKADPNIQNMNLDTPLHCASMYEYYNPAEILVKGNADLNKQNFNGNTPLHISLKFRSTYIVKLLINNKADLNIANKEGKTCLELAKSNGYEDIIQNINKN